FETVRVDDAHTADCMGAIRAPGVHPRRDTGDAPGARLRVDFVPRVAANCERATCPPPRLQEGLRSMQHFFRRSLFVAALFAVLVTSATARAEPYRFPTGKYGNAELKYVGGLPVLVVSGTPEEIGEAVGVLAMKPDLKVLNYPRDLIKEFGAESLYPLIVRSGTHMYERFPAEYKTELDAMAKGAGISKEQLIVGNTLFDVKKLVACSALLVDPERSATGGSLLGRNLDYPALDNIQEHGLVTIYRPKGKHAFASVGFPGLMGVVSGMNDAGLTVAILEVMQIKDGEK